MANQPESAVYDAGVLQLEVTTPVQGGVGGASNAPLLSLANRTAYLKVHLDAIEAASAGYAAINSQAFTGTPTVPNIVLGDRTAKIPNTQFVQDTVNGIATVNVAGNTNVTLTAAQYGAGILNFTGALTGNIAVIVPASSKGWIVSNNTSGAYTLTLKTAAGTGVAITQGRNTLLWCDATNVVDSKTDFASIALTGTPTTPTPADGTSNTQIANAAFLQAALSGIATVNVAGNSNVTLNAAQWSRGILILTGALTGNINVIVPSAADQWIVSNQTSGAFTLTVKTAAGSGVLVAQASSYMIYCDATNVAIITTSADVSYPVVRKPTIQSPTASEVLVGQTPVLQGNNYYSLYQVAQGACQFQVSSDPTFATTSFDKTTSGAVISSQVNSGNLTASTQYYCRCRYQDLEGSWSPWSDGVTFTTGTQTVATPSITAPANGATGVGDGFTITASAFAMGSGVDTHSVTDWEIWTGTGGTGTLVWSSIADPLNKTSIAVPAGTVAPGTTYYPRVRYSGVNSGYSAFSAAVSFATAATFASGAAGAAYGGGFLAGYIVVSGTRYALVVSPRALGQVRNLELSNRSTNLAGAQSVNDGWTNTINMIAASPTQYEAAKFCRDLNIGGYTDWYLPSRDEVEILYRNLKPKTSNNQTGARGDGSNMGVNANSDPAGVAYTNSVPAQTAATDFKTGGSEAFEDIADSSLWSSTFLAGTSNNGWRQKFNSSDNGKQYTSSSGNNCGVRAVRRVPAPL